MHDVPVGIIPSRFWEDYSKPNLPNCDVSFLLYHASSDCSLKFRISHIIGNKGFGFLLCINSFGILYYSVVYVYLALVPKV